jgi:hypothetical protein
MLLKLSSGIAILSFISIILFNVNAVASNDSSEIEVPKNMDNVALKASGNCIYANYRIGGVCSGATERLCEGSPECKHPPKQIQPQ